MMIPPAALRQIQEVLDHGKNFVLTTHVNPDGDGLGSEIAFAEYLQQSGKQVHIFNHSATPENYAFLDPQGEIEQFCDSTNRWLPLLCTMNVTDATEMVRMYFCIENDSF